MFERSLAKSLLAWWDANRLALPWRLSRTPYSVWVSEVMLQQTVVKSAVAHFERWMRAYPDVAALAAASETEVVRLWEGLGYYSRARHLLQAAREVAGRRGGALPQSYDELRSLPGIGDYTARAILSVAFGQRLAAVDANVRRVAQRLLGRETPPADGEIAAGLEAVMPARRPGDFNEALMELGQRVCAAAAPRCGLCPVSGTCRALALGLQSRIPARTTRPVTVRESQVLVLLRGSAVRLCPHRSGLFAGLWTFPRLRPRSARTLLRASGWPPLAELTPRSHTYTTHRERLAPSVFAVPDDARRLTRGEWVALAELERLPMPSTHRRIADELRRRLPDWS